MDPIIFKNIINMHRLHDALHFFKTSLKIALLKIEKHRTKNRIVKNCKTSHR